MSQDEAAATGGRGGREMEKFVAVISFFPATISWRFSRIVHPPARSRQYLVAAGGENAEDDKAEPLELIPCPSVLCIIFEKRDHAHRRSRAVTRFNAPLALERAILALIRYKIHLPSGSL